MTAAVGISNFILNRYPPVLSSVYALAFGTRRNRSIRRASWRPHSLPVAIPLLGIVTVTLFADLLIMRVSTTSVTRTTTGSRTRNAQ